LRTSKVDIKGILTHYSALVGKHNELSRVARELHRQAVSLQREANSLQNHRFNMLSAHLGAINRHLSETYRRVVPGADCYMSYASNQISLFEEGIVLMAQHGRSAWREVSAEC
jgi:chromosome segregation ATPase